MVGGQDHSYGAPLQLNTALLIEVVIVHGFMYRDKLGQIILAKFSIILSLL